MVFDLDARQAFTRFIGMGFVDAILAGNALATHDLEGALYGTASGQEIYSKRSVPLGHYHHLDTINRIRAHRSIARIIEDGIVENGIMHAAFEARIPVVLAGSIRDDDLFPEVIESIYEPRIGCAR